MIIPSIYNHIFEIRGTFYLHNSQSNFFSKISETLFSAIKDRNWDILPDNVMSMLKEKHIVENEGEECNYYYLTQIKYNARNFNPSLLGLVIVPTTNCNFACPYCFEPKKNTAVLTDEVIDNIIKFIKKTSICQRNGFDMVWRRATVSF